MKTVAELREAERAAHRRYMYFEAAERDYDHAAAQEALREWIAIGKELADAVEAEEASEAQQIDALWESTRAHGPGKRLHDAFAGVFGRPVEQNPQTHADVNKPL